MAEKMTGGETQLIYMAQVRDKFLELVLQAKIKSQSPSKLKKIVLKGLQKGIWWFHYIIDICIYIR